MIQDILNSTERLQGGYTHRARVTHADLTQTATNTAQTLELFSVPAGSMVKSLAIVLVTAFKDASDAAFNTNAVTIGDGASASRFLASTQLNENGTEILFAAGIGPAAALASTDGTFAGAADLAAAKAEGEKVGDDVRALFAQVQAGQHVYQADDTVDLVVGSQSGKALADIDTGELVVLAEIVNLAEIAR
jgi:hypothetical protein